MGILTKWSTIWDDTALRAAVRHGQAEMMEFLIGQPMEKDPLLLHLACLHGSSECVRLLIDRGVGVNYTANLDEAENINKNFDTIQDNITPIDLAINYGHRLVVEVLISSNKLMEMMEHARVENNKPTTPMRELIQNMPDLASKVFDNDGSGKLLDDFKLIGDWMPGPSTNCIRRTMFNHPLLIMVKNKREHLLGHKLVNTLVQKKWKEYGLPFLITNVVLQILFLVFITIFIVKTPAPVNGNSSLPNYNQSAYEHGQDAASSNQPQAIAITLIVFMLLILCYHVLIEVVQFWCLRLEYFDWDKLFSWIFYLTSLMFLVPALFCSGRPKPWMWEFGSCAVVFAWLQMLMVIRMNKHFGLYVVMFLRIFKTFISVFLTFLCVLIGFAFAFYMLLANQDTFGSFWYSLATTLVMMTGEFNYSDIFLTDEAELYYKPASYILFILFLILVFIIFMNLLVALAIGDIREELEKANLTKKALQVELSLRVEFNHPSWLRWNCLQKFTNSCCLSFSQEETPIVAPPQYDIEMVVKEQQDLKRQMTMLTNQMMQLQTMIANNSQQ
ncbi:transient receptor potential cation channel subfamily A member 1 homolog isoform X2 [Watersipora subatra]|uniref:transient receptor potential cation channel subfamily A member 1 homolog isoform X2 n=1 Tax=Watersipora subatra TaxID=2589382 RepID=UPI00355BF0B0